jgi:hypothetical protein
MNPPKSPPARRIMNMTAIAVVDAQVFASKTETS